MNKKDLVKLAFIGIASGLCLSAQAETLETEKQVSMSRAKKNGGSTNNGKNGKNNTNNNGKNGCSGKSGCNGCGAKNSCNGEKMNGDGNNSDYCPNCNKRKKPSNY